MDYNRETQEVFFSIQQATRWMDPFLKLTTIGGILLLQYFARMVTEKKLREGTVKDFSEFVKLTEGKYDIMNIPAMDAEQITKELKDMGVRHMVLPDLNKEDGMLQVAVYQMDKDKFGAWYQRHILSEMKGGEKDIQDLRNLTNGRTSILSLPLESLPVQWEEDFKAMQINYATLPDLRVGDGQIQMIVANNDLPQVEHWYKLLKKDLAEEGTILEDYDTISMTEYSQTGQMTEQSYINGAAEEYREANEKYEGQEKGEMEQAVQESQVLKDETAVSFEDYANDPSYLPLSIDHSTLVVNSSCRLQEFWAKGQFACRVPSTWGQSELLLILPLSRVFARRDGESYLAFIKKDEPPQVISAKTGEIKWDSRSGEEFVNRYFDKVQERALQINRTQSMKKDKVINHQGMEMERMDIFQRQGNGKKTDEMPNVSVNYKSDSSTKRPERVIPSPVVKR